MDEKKELNQKELSEVSGGYRYTTVDGKHYCGFGDDVPEFGIRGIIEIEARLADLVDRRGELDFVSLIEEPLHDLLAVDGRTGGEKPLHDFLRGHFQGEEGDRAFAFAGRVEGEVQPQSGFPDGRAGRQNDQVFLLPAVG